MTTLKAKFFIFFALLFAVPAVFTYFTLADVWQLHANDQIAQELKDVEFFVQHKSTWTDADLIRAQFLRSHTSNPELQEAFSLWIQARSEGGTHLISLRTDELQKILHGKYQEISNQSAVLTSQMTYFLSALCVFLFLCAVTGYRYAKTTVLSRVSDITKELSGFRVSEYQTRLLTAVPEDELGDLSLAFHAMIANLYQDLHEDLSVNPNPVESAELSLVPTSFKNEVQAFLVERRIQNDRRGQDRRKRA